MGSQIPGFPGTWSTVWGLTRLPKHSILQAYIYESVGSSASQARGIAESFVGRRSRDTFGGLKGVGLT